MEHETKSAPEEAESTLIADVDGTACSRFNWVDADGTVYPFLSLPSELKAKRLNRHKQDPASPAAIEQVATRFQARSNSDTEMEALLRLLIYKHYDDSKKSSAAKIRETSLTFLTAFCRRRTRLYTSVRAGLEVQYKGLMEGVNHKRGFLLEIRREVAIQIDGVNSTEELENLPKAVHKPIARQARRCLREYTNEKRLSLPDSDMNALDVLLFDNPNDNVEAFVNREAELSEFKALLDTGKLRGQNRELALILCKHPDLAGYGGNVEIARMLGWNPAHVRQIKRRLKIAANS